MQHCNEIIQKEIKERLNTCNKTQLKEFHKRYNIKYHKKDKKHTLVKNITEYWKTSIKETCSICLENIEYTSCVITPCNHLCCDTCIIPYLKNADTCPYCKTNCDYIEIISKINNKRICMLAFILKSESPIDTTNNTIFNNNAYTYIENEVIIHVVSIVLVSINIIELIIFLRLVIFLIFYSITEIWDSSRSYNIYYIMDNHESFG